MPAREAGYLALFDLKDLARFQARQDSGWLRPSITPEIAALGKISVCLGDGLKGFSRVAVLGPF